MDEQQDKDFLAQVAYDDAAALNTRDHIQEHYGSHSQSWYRWVSAHLHARPGMRWLDMGCGPGHLWWRERAHLAAGSKVLLTDLSSGMVAAARHNLDGAGPAFSFTVADSEALPLAAQQFDAVMALGLLDHLPRRAESLAEVRRVLQPGGFFYASAGGRRHLQELERAVQPFLPDVTYGGSAAAFGIENGMAQLEPFFRHVALYLYEDELLFREVEPVVAYVCSEARVGRRLHGELLAAFEAHVATMLADEGVIRVTRQKGLFAAQL
ncbi:MAG: class I SAM-dependent methyltransferase [Anaerolineae bacterium]|nr:class I SAM-dependent methyltransferase [Anaerolineae bacterium]